VWDDSVVYWDGNRDDEQSDNTNGYSNTDEEKHEVGCASHLGVQTISWDCVGACGRLRR